MRCLEQRCQDAYTELAVRCHVEASGFTWFDDRASWVEAADPAEQLAGHLYTHFYTSGQVIRRARRTEVTRDLQPQYDRIAGNERAWFDGWQVTARHPNRVGITDGSVHLSVAPDDVRPAAAADGPHQVRLPRLRRRMSPGFCAIPATAAVPAEDLMRVYISIDKSGAAALLATFLRHSPGLPDVQAKLLSSTASFERLDSFVAYLPPSRLIALTDLFSEIVHCHADHLRPNSPSLTGVLVPGIALAVEPSGGGSFGTTVCRILADALIAGDPSTLPAALRTAGLEDVPVPQALVVAARTWQRPRTPPSRSPALSGSAADPPDAAALGRDIAEVLASSALTVGDQATWLWTPPPLPVGTATALATVGPDHYGGTAGIGTFLLAAAQASGCERFQEVGRRALRHTVARLALGWRHHGAYTGSAPAALALIQAGAEVVGPDAIDQALSVLLEAATPMPGEDNPDLLSGVAGTLLTILRAQSLVKDPALFTCAVALRDRLVTMADRDTGGWPTGEGQALTGFSHGAAGIAYVLSHWLMVASDAEVDELLTRTLVFEDSHFDQAANNWADLRPFASSGDDGPRFAQFWCHGSPGIVLARHAIGAALPQPVDVAGAVEAALNESGAHDPGLCHGLTGLVDIANAVAGPSDQRHRALLQRLQERGPVAMWTESQPDTLQPGLMLGLAGIGDHLLRTIAGSTSTPLLP